MARCVCEGMRHYSFGASVFLAVHEEGDEAAEENDSEPSNNTPYNGSYGCFLLRWYYCVGWAYIGVAFDNDQNCLCQYCRWWIPSLCTPRACCRLKSAFSQVMAVKGERMNTRIRVFKSILTIRGGIERNQSAGL